MLICRGSNMHEVYRTNVVRVSRKKTKELDDILRANELFQYPPANYRTAASMMHRPPGDPAFHNQYHYPPEYYGHHL
ncbi:hypothetical protein ANTQUA_LOCUS7905 [Anthophora quadrimaculata]